jgi:hypothetical protein
MRVGVGVGVWFGIGIGIGIELGAANPARSDAGEAAEIFGPCQMAGPSSAWRRSLACDVVGRVMMSSSAMVLTSRTRLSVM